MTAPLKDGQVSLRLPNDLKDKMHTYAQLTGRTKSYVAMEALKEYLDWRIPQIADLKAAVEAADAGDFASDDEVQRVVSRAAGSTPARKLSKPVKAAKAAKVVRRT